MVNPSTFAYTSWWSELNHFGQTLHAGHAPKLTLADPPAKSWIALAETMPDFRAWLELGASKREKNPDPLYRWLDAVLEDFLGHSPQDYLKHSAVGDGWKVVGPDGRALKPERLLRLNPPDEEHALPVFITAAPLNQKDGKRRALDLDRFLRAKQLPMGIITDGRSLRWVVAGTHQNAFTQWDLLAGWGEGEAKLPWRGLYTLFGRHQGWAATPDKDRPHQLGLWLQESSQMQGDLSTSLGEQIREAVEALVHALDRWSMEDATRLGPLVEVEPDPLKQNHALYTAAVRLVMRLVVIAFAESRGLLPVTLAAYRDSYGLEVLWQRLKRAKGEVGFDHQHSAWVQLLGLFRLVHDGCAHPDLNLRAYGGDLFQPGSASDADPISRAMALWESVDGVPVSDKEVLHVLDRLKRTTVQVNGKAVATPVDFSTLSTEYIGLLYEGLLDYDLRTATEPMLLLNLGQQPLLQLSLLQAKSEKELLELLKELAKEKATKVAMDEENDADEGDDEDAESDDDEIADETGLGEVAVDVPADDEITSKELPEDVPVELMSQAWAWATEAAALMPSRFGLPNFKRGQTKAQKPDDMDTQEWADRLQRAARNLVARVIPPGERYLIRWSGTRKGSGTFYTRPALTEPLISETLKPLCFEADGTPKMPEAILSLRVLDPAMGSASFLVGALRYLTHALYDSLIHHRLREDKPDRVILTLPFGLKAIGSPGESLPPVHPEDPDAEPKLKRRLKRHVVEYCLYGVDLNPLAVELAKLSVWVETLDPDLPFGFLDHKFRCGNGLVGCWVDRIEEYPTAAWSRKGGDGDNGLESKALKAAFSKAVDEMGSILERESLLIHQQRHGQRVVQIPGLGEEHPPQAVLAECREALEAMHSIPPHEVERIAAMWSDLQTRPQFRALKRAMDRWCALFYWPAKQGGQVLEPSSLPMPSTWNQEDHLNQVSRLAQEHQFFHWELAFPEVFSGPEAGFDATLGNPPWEILKPNSNEFFTVYDPIFRTYKGTKADDAKATLFTNHPGLEAKWQGYVATYKSHSGWAKGTDNPFRLSTADDKAKKAKKPSTKAPSRQALNLARMLAFWEARRANHPRHSDPEHPLRLQGSADLNTYKMFLEQARALLKTGGRLGFLVPSGLYTDEGSMTLRKTFFGRDHWELLFGFENRAKIFQIDSRFKFVATVVTKGCPSAKPLQAVFMRLDSSDLALPEAHTMPVTLAEVEAFSPKNISFMELRNKRDLEVAQKLYDGHPLLGDLGLEYNSELHMKNDAKLWAGGDRAKLEAQGLLGADSDTRDPRVRFTLWKAGWMPLLEGKHFWQFNPGYVGIRRRKGSAPLTTEGYAEALAKATASYLQKQKFIPIPRLMDRAKASLEKDRLKAIKDGEPFSKGLLDYMGWLRPRLVFRDVARSTDQRTYIATLVPPGPHGNKAPDISVPNRSSAFMAGLLNSLVNDWIIRRKVSATLNKFYIETLPIPEPSPKLGNAIADLASQLCGVGFSPIAEGAARLEARLKLDALVAKLFDLDVRDLEHILLDPSAGAVGFHRLDGDLPEDWRQPKLIVDAYQRLLAVDVDTFLAAPLGLAAPVLAAIRPTLSMASPEGGWDEAWKEAKAMAESPQEWDLFLGKEEAIETAFGFEQPAFSLAAEPNRTRDAFALPSAAPTSLFDPEDLG